jgi:hypothetical protein
MKLTPAARAIGRTARRLVCWCRCSSQREIEQEEIEEDVRELWPCGVNSGAISKGWRRGVGQ